MFVIEFLITVLTFVFELLMSVMYGVAWLLVGWQLALMGTPVPSCSICLW
jgi:uncharacterized membrane protein (DUF485 family)